MTSAAERACELVGNMLAGGPRDAAEILAAAGGSKVSARSIQRASIQLGVAKTRTEFNGGWMWRLPDDDGGNTDAPMEQPAPGVLKVVDVFEHPTARAETIAARLRKLEAGRGKKAPIYAQDPRVIRWAQSGISDPDLREAYERAMTDFEGDGPVTAGFLDPIVMKVISEGAKA